MRLLGIRIPPILRIFVYLLMLLPLLYSTFASTLVSAESSSKRPVYIVKVENTIERGLFAYMQRAFKEAEDHGAQHIILEINTPGGEVLAAGKIGELIDQAPIPITAFVNPDAISAGAFIALNADQIIMVPMASMGAATVVDLEGNAGDAKTMSYWLNKMGRAAEVHGRDRLYAEAMVDPEIEIEGLTHKDQPLTFDAEQAVAHGYAEAILSTRAEVLEFLGLEGAPIVEVEISAAEHLARFITHPIVVSILFSLAGLGLILELYSPGFGLPGIIGLSSLLLFFCSLARPLHWQGQLRLILV